MYLEELAEAAILDSQHSLDPDKRFSSPWRIVDVCSSLATVYDHVDNGTTRKQVCFAHNTVKEYLLSFMISASAKAAAFSVSEIHAQQLISHVNLS